MIKIRKYLLMGVILSFLAFQCKEGCSDPEALNYNESADDDNGTCVYE